MIEKEKNVPTLIEQERLDMATQARLDEYRAKYFEAIAKLEHSIAERECADEIAFQQRGS